MNTLRNTEEYIEVDCGSWLGDVVEHFKHMNRAGLKRKMQFNGVWIYSDMTADEIWKAVTGKTEEEANKERIETIEKIKKENEEFESRALDIIAEYKEKGSKILPSNKLKAWYNIVENSINNYIYHGSDLDATLELFRLKDDVNKAREVFRAQGHSGSSGRLVCSELHELLDNSDNFIREICS